MAWSQSSLSIQLASLRQANGVMNLKFTRLKKSEAASLCLHEQFQQCEHYTGPKKFHPPNLKQTVSPLSDVAHLATSFAKAKDRDVACKAKEPIRVLSIVGYATFTSRYNADHYGVHGQSHAEFWDGVHNSDL